MIKGTSTKTDTAYSPNLVKLNIVEAVNWIN